VLQGGKSGKSMQLMPTDWMHASTLSAIDAEDTKESNKIAYMARAMIMATFPHSKPDSHVFQRTNGDYTLSMIGHPEFGLPYGSTLRFLFIWLITQAVDKRSPEIQLGKSFSDFIKKLGMQRGGGKRGNATRIRDQMMRLLTCSISSIYQDKKKGICDANQFHISRSFQFCWNPLEAENKSFLSNSKIILSQDFYNELLKSAVPIQFGSVKLLQKSPLQIDIYIWLTYKFFNLKKEQTIAWKTLKNQFGCDYANADGVFHFRRKFIQSLKKVLFVYPTANVYTDNKGITLYPSETLDYHIKCNFLYLKQSPSHFKLMH
jgi:hypothetical protein